MMGVFNPIYVVLLLLSVFTIKSSNCIQSNTISCPQIEKSTLLTLKKSLKDPNNLLSSWDGAVDCCKWKGVVCNNSTGHVHQLHLQGKILGDTGFGLSGKISPSLLNLKHLTYLDLSYNSFYGRTIPSFFGSFTNLEHLDLSFANFQGDIPHSIGNLSNLLTLSLEGVYYFSGSSRLVVDSLEWLSGLSKLEFLDMNGANLSRATNWAKVINSLPSLLEIHLSSCNLDLSAPPDYVNLTSLTFLDLSYNYAVFSLSIPQWLFQLRNLLFLIIKRNNLQGPFPTVSNATKIQHLDMSSNVIQSIPDWLYFCKDLRFLSLANYPSGNVYDFKANLTSPQSHDLSYYHLSESIGNLTSLKNLDLSYTQLSGKIPKEISYLCQMQYLGLSSNQLHGEMQDSFGNMSHCFLQSLEMLSLSENHLSGELVDQFGEFKVLQHLSLSSNLLSGEIPTTLGNLLSLKELFLDNNNFIGNLPQCLGQLFNLETLFIENNKLEGIVTESHFTNLSNLRIFSASRNHLTLNVGISWTPPIHLYELGLQSWDLGVGSEVPPWLQTPKFYGVLDLSSTGISGSIPSWFFSNVCFLNVSHNNLHGKLPHRIGNERCLSQIVYLSCNKLNGSLPQVVFTMSVMDLSHNSFTEGLSNLLCDTTYEKYALKVLVLEGNHLKGGIPDCWKQWPWLQVLKLGNNSISGNIPHSIGLLMHLMSLSLHDNKLSGQIPSTMHNCTNLWKINLRHNNLDGNIPTWMGTHLVHLKFLILRSNKLSGEIPSNICHLQTLQILDLSSNQFSGIIPRCISNFTAMVTKRLLDLEYTYSTPLQYFSYGLYSADLFDSESVMTKGVELEYSTILSLVINIDLSSNNLSGDIPKELTSLVELQSLNLSGNHLTGSIPTTIGDMKQLESLDLSNNSLSGQIPNGFKLLSSLSHLNLSLNKLTGSIPESTQLRGFDPTCFMGNNLCGPPVSSNCSGEGGEVRGDKEENEGNRSEIEWLYILLSLGYAMGFSAACTALVLKESWRDAYFGFMECIWNKLCLYCCIKRDGITKSAPTS